MLLQDDTPKYYSVRFPCRTFHTTGSVDGGREWKGRERKDVSESLRDPFHKHRDSSLQPLEIPDPSP